MQNPLLPFADELQPLTDRQLCEIANQPLDDSPNNLPTIELDCEDTIDDIKLV